MRLRRKLTLPERSERDTRRMARALRKCGFRPEAEPSPWAGRSWQGVWGHPEGRRQVVLTTLSRLGQCEAEIYDPSRRPDIRLAYTVADLERMLGA